MFYLMKPVLKKIFVDENLHFFFLKSALVLSVQCFLFLRQDTGSKIIL